VKIGKSVTETFEILKIAFREEDMQDSNVQVVERFQRGPKFG